MFKWIARSLIRSRRVRFATAVAIVFHLLSTLLLIRLNGRRDMPGFAYLTGFVPIAILATVTQGNLFGVDRGSALLAFVTPIRAMTFCRLKLIAALLWTLATLSIGWIVGVTAIGPGFVPVMLLQLALVFLLCAAGGVLSVFAPSSRAYARTTGPTMSVAALVPLNVVSLLGIGGGIELLASVKEIEKKTPISVGCMLAGLFIEIVVIVLMSRIFESRRDYVMDALRENP